MATLRKLVAPAAVAFSMTAETVIAAPPIEVDTGNESQIAQTHIYSRDQVRTFSEITVRIQDIRKRYTSEIADVTDENQREKIIEGAQEQMVLEIKKDERLSVNEYIRMAEAVRYDPSLAREVEFFKSRLQR